MDLVQRLQARGARPGRKLSIVPPVVAGAAGATGGGVQAVKEMFEQREKELQASSANVSPVGKARPRYSISVGKPSMASTPPSQASPPWSGPRPKRVSEPIVLSSTPTRPLPDVLTTLAEAPAQSAGQQDAALDQQPQPSESPSKWRRFLGLKRNKSTAKSIDSSSAQDLVNTPTLPLHELQTTHHATLQRLGVVVSQKERHLNDAEFEEALGCSRGQFQALPSWSQQQKKKMALLF